MKRHAGVIIPLWSVTSTKSWGIGELPDLAPLALWLTGAGFDRVMLLPTGPLAGGDTSPYSAISAMAIDPIYIGIDDVPEFSRAGGVLALDAETRADLQAARESSTVAYEHVRRVKGAALARAFDHFFSQEWAQLTLRASELAGYISRERWWLDDHALYLAVAHATGLMNWRDWPPPLRERESSALDEARRNLSREVLRHQYLQWIAEPRRREFPRSAPSPCSGNDRQARP